ncbi:hypothetical protein [Comamonas sp. JC664]|uniref:hypothetical protein n=1 Tax=Comamonas sp. JC664 TaxID=2801917 RepID=UPI00174E5BFF|nr:hypothetical protein [Comamonas sp. JC664]MBL0694710.1 hypothetical protein [Comamonas sp. JC664]GHG94167.1 hypothetical protein GCM10012319_56880 [Comamonas sp. KCTC 72670]
MSHVQTADTLGAGRFQFAIEPGALGAAVLGGDSATAGVVMPHFDMALRYGVSERVDVGARVGFSLAELQTKVLLTQPNDPDLAISLAPSISGASITMGDEDEGISTRYVNVALPLLVGFKTDGGSELVLGPRVIYTRFGGVNLLSAGGSLGYALRVSNGLRVMPEVGISFPLVGKVDGSGADFAAGFNGGFAQFKLGFLFGAGRPIRRNTDANPSDYVEETDRQQGRSDDVYRASERGDDNIDY